MEKKNKFNIIGRKSVIFTYQQTTSFLTTMKTIKNIRKKKLRNIIFKINTLFLRIILNALMILIIRGIMYLLRNVGNWMNKKIIRL